MLLFLSRPNLFLFDNSHVISVNACEKVTGDSSNNNSGVGDRTPSRQRPTEVGGGTPKAAAIFPVIFSKN